MESLRTQYLTPEALELISRALGAGPEELRDVTPTAAGMTNRSFRFTCRGQGYILRGPGEGTDQLINRRNEAASYQAVGQSGLTDRVLAMDPETGYKLTEFWPETRNCDPENPDEVRACMAVLRNFHEKRYQVSHSFDLFGQILFYETLMGGVSEYPDYPAVRQRCLGLKGYLDTLPKDCCLTHIDAVPDNFLFVRENGAQTVHLIDWEYAGMQDPHVDIAMFAIYAGYDRNKLDGLIDLYFPEGCGSALRLKIYCYVALSGLLWSNWCEYKKALGVDFGDYARMQYRYAAEYSLLAGELIEKQAGGAEA